MKFLFSTLLLSLILSGCEIINRPPIRTDIIRGQAEKEHAQAHILEAHARIANDYALCREAQFPKGVASRIVTDCGSQPVSPITVNVIDSRKAGEVPQLQLVPPLPGIGILNGLTGGGE